MAKVKDIRLQKTVDSYSFVTLKYPLKIRVDNDLQDAIEVVLTNPTSLHDQWSSNLKYFDEGLILRIKKKQEDSEQVVSLTYTDFTIKSLLAHDEVYDSNVKWPNHRLWHTNGKEWRITKHAIRNQLKQLKKDVIAEIKKLDQELKEDQES